jgi:hypothetical protein
MVAQVTGRPTITFLNLHQLYPNLPMAAVIFAATSASLEICESFKFKNGEIYRTTEYAGINGNQNGNQKCLEWLGIVGTGWELFA